MSLFGQQEVHSQLCTQKAVLQRISESLKMMYSDKNTPIPEEIEGLLQEVSQSLQEVEEQVWCILWFDMFQDPDFTFIKTDLLFFGWELFLYTVWELLFFS